jgi:nitrous oxidase accessory protein NosD
MRGKPKIKKDSKFHNPELKPALKSLNERAYNSKIEYHETLSTAAGIIAQMAADLAYAEADQASLVKKKNHRKTIEVYPADDPVADFKNIQNAIDRAWPNDRVLLKSGTFKSCGVLWICKDIIIEGEKGAIIEGQKDRGKVVANPATNGGFVLIRNPRVEMRNLHFKNLYFAITSLDHHELDSLLLENNTFEDVYHSVYLSGIDSTLVAKGNKIRISSLDQNSSSKFNFYDESHIFGIYCSGIRQAIIEDNKIEIANLAKSSQFHSIGVYCSLGECIIRDNYFKGLHAPLVLHELDSPIILNNQFYGMSSDSIHKPVAIMLEHCIHPVVCSNKVTCKLSKGSGIHAINNTHGKILSNELDLHNAESGIILHQSDNFIIGKNEIRKRADCSIGIFGNQSVNTQGNLVFSNAIETELLMAYAKGNTVIGEDILLSDSNKISRMLTNELEMDANRRRERIAEHLDRKRYPDVPNRYKGDKDE